DRPHRRRIRRRTARYQRSRHEYVPSRFFSRSGLTALSPRGRYWAGMKRRILLILPLLLLLLAGAGAYALFGGGEAVAEVEVRDSPEPGIFVDLDTISLPVFRDGRVRRLIGLAITIELAPGEDPERVAAALPRIEDAYITELTMLLGLDWPDGISVDLE